MRLKSELSSSRARGSVLLFQSVVKARGGWHWGTRFLARHGHQYGPPFTSGERSTVAWMCR